jgi:hypothetical protein
VEPANLGNSFAAGANSISAHFFGLPPVPGKFGWIAIGALLVLGYRLLEAYAMRRQAPMLDSSKLATAQADLPPGLLRRRSRGAPVGRQHDWIVGELKFRLAAVEVRAPATLPGATRTDGVARIAEASGVSGAGLAGAIIRFLGSLWPSPPRYELFAWVEADAAEVTPRAGQLTVQLDDPRTGLTVATKTIAAHCLADAPEMAAGYIAGWG